MFRSSPFDQGIRSCDVSGATDMSFMFMNASSYNIYSGMWNVSKVNNLSYMFSHTYVFNQDIGSRDVSRVKNISGMFLNATDLYGSFGTWDVSGVTYRSFLFIHRHMTEILDCGMY
jgi:hypothetical protein